MIKRSRIIFSIALLGLFLTSGCAKGLSESEKLACEAFFTSWKSTDLSEATDYLNLGVSELGDNSETSKVLLENKNAAEYLNQTLRADPEADSELKKMVTDLRYAWGEAYETGRNLMWSLVVSSREGKPVLSDQQMTWSVDTSKKMIEAGSLATKIRGYCLEIGYSGS